MDRATPHGPPRSTSPVLPGWLMSGNWWRREEWRGLTARDARPPGTASPSATLGSRRPGVVPSIDCHSSHTLPHSEAGNLWSPVAIYGDRLPSLRASASLDEHADPLPNPSRNDSAPMRDLARFRVRIANPASRAAASISPAEAGPEPRISRDHPWAWRRCGASRSGWQAAWSGVAVRSGPGLQPVTLGPDAAGRPGHHHMPDMSRQANKDPGSAARTPAGGGSRGVHHGDRYDWMEIISPTWSLSVCKTSPG